MPRTKPLALLLAGTVALGASACGTQSQTVAEFCQPHGGVNVQTIESDGDALCMDGTEFEAEDHSSHKHRIKKAKRH